MSGYNNLRKDVNTNTQEIEVNAQEIDKLKNVPVFKEYELLGTIKSIETGKNTFKIDNYKNYPNEYIFVLGGKNPGLTNCIPYRIDFFPHPVEHLLPLFLMLDCNDYASGADTAFNAASLGSYIEVRFREFPTVNGIKYDWLHIFRRKEY